MSIVQRLQAIPTNICKVKRWIVIIILNDRAVRRAFRIVLFICFIYICISWTGHLTWNNLLTEPSAEVMEIKGTSGQHRLVSNSKMKRCSSLSFFFKRCWIRVRCFHLLGKSRLTSPSSWFPSCYIRSVFAYFVYAGYSFKLWRERLSVTGMSQGPARVGFWSSRSEKWK